MDEAAVLSALSLLEAQPFDLLLILQATFADSTLAIRLARAASQRAMPILLWAIPEERVGGRLRLNSLCGINLAGHALHLQAIAYDFVLAAPDAQDAIDKVQSLAQAGRARRLLNGARVGVVGIHPDGFETCQYEDGDLHSLFGLYVERIALEEVLHGAAAASQEERQPFLDRVAALTPNLTQLDAAAVAGTAGVHAELTAQVRRRALSGVAIRCWPEFFSELGCAACGAMSLLGEDGCPAGCEADVNGTVTSMLLQALSGEPAFIADLVSVDPASDSAVLWHCGLAPVSMADPERAIVGTVHSNRRQPLLFEFGLKPGRVTVARLHRHSHAAGAVGYRVVVGGGEMLSSPRAFSGSSGVIRFDRPAHEVLERIIGEGIEHHLSITYGDHGPALRAFARLVGLEVVELT
jgi:L-fucose isomerase-like protein